MRRGIVLGEVPRQVGLIRRWGYRRVELESDCLEAVRVATSSSDVLGGSALVGLIRRLLGKDWRVVVKHVVRDRNRVTDLLVKRGRTLRMGSSIFLDPPGDTLSLVEEEQPAYSLTIDTPIEVELVVSFNPGGIGC
ncbi:hypothetical protein V6N11_031916 [Hibiscus sabdariffa]|uniref:RNase H type-1 domain-containing protein n=1 Tax=Hibiscus sabdariffa TaxID=183260 RepID=A0ABR2SZ24_9ROSI